MASSPSLNPRYQKRLGAFEEATNEAPGDRHGADLFFVDRISRTRVPTLLEKSASFPATKSRADLSRSAAT
jgi:hypothetical protein